MKSIYHFTYQNLIMGLIFFFGYSNDVVAQGCVAIRNMSCSGGNLANQDSSFQTQKRWTLSLNSRYFESYKHFRGDHEEKERVENGTQVINQTFATDLSLGYRLGQKWNISIALPLIMNDRSSLYEHYGNSLTANPEQKRFHTQSSGIGDLRLSASYLFRNPVNPQKFNLALGLGIKLPTGNSNVQDDFHRRSAEGTDIVTTRAVDQSIQLGDKGLGFSIETQGNWLLSRKIGMYFNGFYLFNPRNTNNTLTRGTLTGVDPLIAYHSVADQYALRLGVNYGLFKQSLQVGLGGRLEGLPSRDILGKSEGFRRPGHIVSIEPSVFYQWDVWQVGLNVPIALYRNRTKSVYDLADPTGVRHGDAAFADYLVNLSIAYRFGR